MRMEELRVPKARMSRFLGLPRRALYPTPRSGPPRLRPDEAWLRRSIWEVALAHTNFGHRRITSVLCDRGWEVNRTRVHRIMREEQLLQPAHFPRPRIPENGSLSTEHPMSDGTWILSTSIQRTGARARWC